MTITINNGPRKTLLSIAFLLAVTFFFNQSLFAGTLKGRDYVRMGKPVTVNGVLVQNGPEWELKINDEIYEIHLGPAAYRESKGFTMKQGDPAVVSGFLYQKNIAVAEITTAGKTIVLRNSDGSPAWRGSRFARSRNNQYSNKAVPGETVDMNKLPQLDENQK